MLPLEVLEKAQKEMLDCGGSGQSVMEMSHRSKEYQAIIDEAESLLREIMDIPDNYKVLFLQGGASTQFAMIPLNLAKNKKADFKSAFFIFYIIQLQAYEVPNYQIAFPFLNLRRPARKYQRRA